MESSETTVVSRFSGFPPVIMSMMLMIEEGMDTMPKMVMSPIMVLLREAWIAS